MRISLCCSTFVLAVVASPAYAITFGNTSPFETQASHSPNFVLGVQVEVTQDMTATSFGLMYGHETSSQFAANARFGLYSSAAVAPLPSQLLAVTNVVTLSSLGTYDNIAFQTPVAITAGTYWMMAQYSGDASPRMSLANANSLVAYWSQPFGLGMNPSAPTVATYTGQNFNYWINGDAVVPEPATMALLGLAAVAALRKRKNR